MPFGFVFRGMNFNLDMMGFEGIGNLDEIIYLSEQ
jgi:hypothetical protein